MVQTDSKSHENNISTGAARSTELPLLSVIVPVYNEKALLERHLAEIVAYLEGLETEFDWEIVIVNDGSVDGSTSLTTTIADHHPKIFAIHHPTNFGLGQAMRFGFNNTRGDIVVTMDVDLSYDVEHIGELARVIQSQSAKVVLASPYMKGGTIRNVPWLRKTLSVWGNRFLSFFAKGHFSTLTSMMRAYDGRFIRSLNLRSMGMEIMPETVQKAMILGGTVVEVPGRLDWAPQKEFQDDRVSSLHIVRHLFATILAGFIFRPFLFFIIPGLLIAAFSAYVNFWMFVHYFEALKDLQSTNEAAGISEAFALAYQEYPHTFVFGLLTAMLAVQLIGLGVLAVQNKHYFDELFDLNSAHRREKFRKSRG